MLFHHSTDIWQLFDRCLYGPCLSIQRAPLFIYAKCWANQVFLLAAIKADGAIIHLPTPIEQLLWPNESPVSSVRRQYETFHLPVANFLRVRLFKGPSQPS